MLKPGSIPWDCTDWQAFAHDDRTTAILESLAENRGKTLYCGVDQSDTFTKAETWEAGRDRNERDDTVYFGERGQFRGFIAAQEGYLTDGESGVTGVSIDRIFEFPREERRRVKRVKRWAIGSGDVNTDTCMTDVQDGRQPGTLVCSDWGSGSGSTHGGSGVGGAKRDAQARYDGRDVNRSLLAAHCANGPPQWGFLAGAGDRRGQKHLSFPARGAVGFQCGFRRQPQPGSDADHQRGSRSRLGLVFRQPGSPESSLPGPGKPLLDGHLQENHPPHPEVGGCNRRLCH